jgi:signal transduction histidine kinase
MSVCMRNDLSPHQAIDSDAQSKLREGEERFRAFVMATSDAIYSMSPDWREMRYLVGKDFIADTTGPSGSWLERYIPLEDRAEVLSAIDGAIQTSSTFELEHRVIRANGVIGWTFSRAVPIKNAADEIVEWFGAARDITERRLREEALRQADWHKDQFLAVLAHELRNPLAPMTNALELLRKTDGNQRLRSTAQAILERQLMSLTRLVDDLLETARIASGRLELRTDRVELRAVLERAVETARPKFESRNQSLTVAIRASRALDADAARLQQVFVNLLNNAAKYTDAGGHIHLSADVNGDWAVIKVTDTGIGIDPELLPRLFEPFSQAKRARPRSEGGLGLGLSIARRLVEMHGGTIKVASVPGRGSEFTIELPLDSGAD